MAPSSFGAVGSSKSIKDRVFAGDSKKLNVNIPEIIFDNIPDLEGKQFKVNWLFVDWCLNDSKCNKDEVVKRLKSIIEEELIILKSLV